MIIRSLLVPLTLAIVAVHAGPAGAQGAFPAPLPGPLPPVNGAAPSAAIGAPSKTFLAGGAAPITGSSFPRPPAPQGGGSPDQCMKVFMPLREETESRGKRRSRTSSRPVTRTPRPCRKKYARWRNRRRGENRPDRSATSMFTVETA